ncbi:CRISPR-associated endonuclease Cas2 [Asticcacaulis endophyticus]|uniref:CRISPR-associated endoribonuclease Cas2 n=1 Tax=Asticcacaulis endophyticus TaxID=1395890 RepID=A0A918UTH1_9CAUL|nr:CRISPR-associated endonuclease Cas2 [Asticcacaulis endophyticus]GGZ32964.1 CRISPR-associated endoribonuclease Cas2 [Asticcacaulis endophyticus]
MTHLSAYRIMWIMALFDLPVVTKPERKRATAFRNFLLDQGFEMVQFSVYARFSFSKEKAEVITRKVGKAVPAHGKVDILYFTDKQYQQIVSFRGKNESFLPKNPEQLALF